MPIRGILNGYYRSGTTILWWIFQLSNLDKPIIYEPHSPSILEQARKYGCMHIDGLHGFPLLMSFYMVKEHIFEEYLDNAIPKPIYEKPDEAVETIEMFHRESKDVYVQPNQLHFVLNEVSAKFGCKYVHVMRSPIDTFWSHLPPNIRKENAILDIACGGHYDKLKGSFWIEDCYNVGKKFIDRRAKGDYIIDKFLISWTAANYVAMKNSQLTVNGMVVKFEDFLENPKETFEKVGDFLGLKVIPAYTQLLNRNRASSIPKKERELLKNIMFERVLLYDLAHHIYELGYLDVFATR